MYSADCGSEVEWMICEENQAVSSNPNGGEVKTIRSSGHQIQKILRMQIAVANRVSHSVQLFISKNPFHHRKTSLIRIGIKDVISLFDVKPLEARIGTERVTVHVFDV